MIKKYRLTTVFLLGLLAGGTGGLYMGYNLPREPTTSINIDSVKAKKGSNVDLNIEAETETLTKKEKRKLKRNK